MQGYHFNVQVSLRLKMIVMKNEDHKCVPCFSCEMTFIFWVKWSGFELNWT